MKKTNYLPFCASQKCVSSCLILKKHSNLINHFMRKALLLTLIGFGFGLVSNSQTTYTTPASGTATVQDITTWQAAFTTTNVVTATPLIYTIQPSYTLIIGPTGAHTVNMPAGPTYDFVTINVNGKLGFYQSNNNLTVPGTATVNIGVGGEIGFVHPSIGQCCVGNSATQISIGSDIYKAPFNYDGPQSVTQGTLLAQSTFWTGATNTDWNTAGNWANIIPTYTCNAIIQDVANDPVIPAASTYTVNKLILQPLAVLTINGAVSPATGGALVAKNIIINDGTVTVKSGGSLVQTASSTTVTGTGTFNVESAIPGAVQFIGSPINTIAANGFGITPTGTNGGQIVPQPACSPTAIATGSPYGNLLELRENPTVLSNCAQSLWHVKSSGTLENGRGYSLANGAATLVYSGTVNNGSIAYNGLTRQNTANLVTQDGLGSTRGWHLVSNPYPSPIKIDGAMLSGMGFDEQVQLYDHNGSYTGVWVPFSTAATTLPVTIAVGQSFQIRTTANPGSANFTLTNSCRVVGTPVFYKLLAKDYLQITLNNGVKTDATNIYFEAGASDAFDPAFDANRLSDDIQWPMIYSVVNDDNLSYNGLPVMNANDTKTVTIGVRTEVQGAHSLTFTGVNAMTSSILLKDLKLNSIQPVTEGYVYNFTTAAGDNKNRFEIHFSADGLGISTNNTGSIKLFPNPVDGTTTLYLDVNHGFNHATITDVCGKTVQTFGLNENDNMKSIDMNGLNAGVYFLKLSGSGVDAGVTKLIKK